MDESIKQEARLIVQEIRTQKEQKRLIDLSKLEAFANRLGGNHPVVTSMLDEVEAMGIDVVERILKQHADKKMGLRRFTLAK
ncbi:MAG: hypothetical protein BroJett025_00510 [Patescibacteria group bacterium]|nr:MAG: hypothetical protein BroJett025_00510 [Patescibacteria group bacterium]